MRLVYFNLILLLFFYPIASFTQSKIEALSLLHLVSEKNTDTLLVKKCIKMAWELKYSEPEMALKLSYRALNISQQLQWKKGEAESHHSLGLNHYLKGNHKLALQHYDTSLHIIEVLLKGGKIKNNHSEIISLKAKTLGYAALVLTHQGNLKKSLEYYHAALQLEEQLDNKNGIARNLGNIGIAYFDLKNYPKSLEYYFKALRLAELTGYTQLQANTYGNIGLVYADIGDKLNALDYFSRALEMADKNGFKELQANTLDNIGKIYESKDENAKALDRYLIALRIKESFGSSRDIGISLNYIGALYLKIKKYKEAEYWLMKAKACADSTGTTSIKKETYSVLANLFAQTNRWKEAYNCFYIFLSHHDTLITQQNQREIANKEIEFEYTKKAAQDSVKNAEEKKTSAAQLLARDEQLKRANLQRYVLFGGLSLFLVFGILMYRRFRITQSQKLIIEKQKLTVEEQRDLVKEKNKEILDSIVYAKRLQEAILPSLKSIEEVFPNFFIIYIPKDIVAGDFYWMEETQDKIFIAAGDCTGHGVPGAMVSVVCSSALSRVVKEFGINQTGKILDKTRELVLETFEKSEKDVKDGMDISLLSLDKKNGHMHWSGANNRLWHTHNGNLTELTADKQPIGKTEISFPFSTHKINVQKNDCLYLITDGFTDQFGGSEGKKFKYVQLRQLLRQINYLPVAEQKQILEQTFENWKGQLEQTDDVCVIGIRL